MAGVDLRFAPIGQFSAHANGASESADLETSMGIRPYFDFAVSEQLSIGFAPQVIFGVRTQYDDTSAKQFDLMARGSFRLAKSDRLTPILYASGGWSTLRLPESRVGHPSGFTFDIGGGIAYDISPRASVSAALGYQSSAMGLTVQGDTVGISTSFLHFGIGVGTLL